MVASVCLAENKFFELPGFCTVKRGDDRVWRDGTGYDGGRPVMTGYVQV